MWPLFFLLLSFGCKQNEVKQIAEDISFNQIIKTSDRFVVKLYDTIVTKRDTRSVERFPHKSEYQAASTDKTAFGKIFENAERTGYCCCPTAVYAISFFKNNERLDIFYVDTLEFKNKIRIYEGSFQYSYIIEKQTWKNYLNTITK